MRFVAFLFLIAVVSIASMAIKCDEKRSITDRASQTNYYAVFYNCNATNGSLTLSSSVITITGGKMTPEEFRLIPATLNGKCDWCGMNQVVVHGLFKLDRP